MKGAKLRGDTPVPCHAMNRDAAIEMNRVPCHAMPCHEQILVLLNEGGCCVRHAGHMVYYSMLEKAMLRYAYMHTHVYFYNVCTMRFVSKNGYIQRVWCQTILCHNEFGVKRFDYKNRSSGVTLVLLTCIVVSPPQRRSCSFDFSSS